MDGMSGPRFACKHPAVNIKNVNFDISFVSELWAPLFFVVIFKIAPLKEEFILTYQKN